MSEDTPKDNPAPKPPDPPAPSAPDQSDGKEAKNDGQEQAKNLRIKQLNESLEFKHTKIEGGVNIFYAEGEFSRRKFARDRDGALTRMEEAQDIASSYIGSLNTIYEWAQKLHKLRIIMLTGEPDSGKWTTAMVIADRLKREFDPNVAQIYNVKPLDPQISIDFTADIIGNDSLANCVVLFNDALAKRNPDVSGFVTNLKKRELEHLTHCLSAAGSFLIFVANSATTWECREMMQKLGIYVELPPLDEEFLRKAISVSLRHFLKSNPTAASKIESKFGADQQTSVIKKCQTIAGINTLINHHLPEILEDRLTVEEAIERVDNVKYWFCNEVADNLETWCFVLTLTLLLGNPYFEGAPWLELDRLRRVVARCVRRELMLFDNHNNQKPKGAVNDSYFLEQCKAETFCHEGTGIEMIKFKNDLYRERLWDILLSHNRRILTALLPELKKIAESGEIRSSALAASIIGRIGQLDPGHVRIIANNWARSGDNRLKEPLAHLFYTAFGSPNSSYRNRCLGYLEDWESNGNTDLMTSAIAAYTLMGLPDPHFAMRHIGQIVKTQFGEDKNRRPRDQQLMHRLEHDLLLADFLEYLEERLNNNELESIDDLLFEDYLQRMYKKGLKEKRRQFSEREINLLLAIENAISDLCTFADCINVLSQVRHWMAADSRGVAPFVALIFLRTGGVAERLEAKRISLHDADGEEQNSQSMSCNPIVALLPTREDGVILLSRFMRDLYRALSSFPPNSRHFLRKSFFIRLKRWAKNSLSVKSRRGAVESLYAEILMMAGSEVSGKLQEFLNTDPDFSYLDSELIQFAEAVKRRRLGRMKSIDSVQ